MRGIELYCGETGLYPSEKAVLTELMTLLAARNEEAIIFSNFTMGHRQIDLFVATATVTLQIEVKGYRKRVEGDVNGEWQVTDRSGIRLDRRNAFCQARANNWAMRDAMSKVRLRDSAYPRGAVVFSPVIPAGSVFSPALRKHPHVAIIGQHELGTLLSKPHRTPWPLEDVRRLALATKLRPCTTIDEMASNTGIEDADDDQLDADEMTRSTSTRPQGRSRRGKQRLLALATVLVLLALVPLSKWFTRNDNVPVAATPVAHTGTSAAPTIKPVPPKVRPAKSVEPAVARPVEPVVALNRHPAPRPAAPIHCPANVERLGCNGRIGDFDAPQCPAGFHVDGESCAPD